MARPLSAVAQRRTNCRPRRCLPLQFAGCAQVPAGLAAATVSRCGACLKAGPAGAANCPASYNSPGRCNTRSRGRQACCSCCRVLAHLALSSAFHAKSIYSLPACVPISGAASSRSPGPFNGLPRLRPSDTCGSPPGTASAAEGSVHRRDRWQQTTRIGTRPGLTRHPPAVRWTPKLESGASRDGLAKHLPPLPAGRRCRLLRCRSRLRCWPLLQQWQQQARSRWRQQLWKQQLPQQQQMKQQQQRWREQQQVHGRGTCSARPNPTSTGRPPSAASRRC